ncbi:MAG: MgtC/SapB family protein [Burkholderiales bacterium]|nr:MAG: MgtC/SapB family protein [Burkholderiales bacterium]
MSADLSRVIQGVIAGIGFLGAGAIIKIRDEHNVQGLTTAAGVWMTGAIGVACGLGRESTALLSALFENDRVNDDSDTGVVDANVVHVIVGPRLPGPERASAIRLGDDLDAVVESADGGARRVPAGPALAEPTGSVVGPHCRRGTTSTDVEPSGSMRVRWISPSGSSSITSTAPSPRRRMAGAGASSMFSMMPTAGAGVDREGSRADLSPVWPWSRHGDQGQLRPCWRVSAVYANWRVELLSRRWHGRAWYTTC